MRRHATASFIRPRLLGLLAFATTAFFAFAAPQAFAVSGEVGTFATNSGNLGEPGNPAGSGSGDGQLFNPGQLDVNDSSGRIYVADTGNNRVEVFKPNATGGEYDSQASIAAPTGLAIDQATGDVYVSNASGVAKFDEDLNPIVSGWTAPAATGPLAVDPSTGDLLLADTAGNLLRRFEADGTAAGTFAAERPIDVAANSTGQIFVVTSTGDLIGSCGPTSAVERFSAAGAPAGSVGTLTAPGAVAIDPDDDSIVVAAHVGEYACEAGKYPEVAFFDSSGTFEEAVVFDAVPGQAPGPSMYASIPGLTAQGGGSSRVYAATKSPANDQYGTTQIFAVEELAAPEATIAAATPIGPFTATLRGEVNPKGSPTSCRFEYWNNASADKIAIAPCVENPGAGTNPVSVHADVEQLKMETLYHFRLVASKSNGALVETSGEATFTTAHAELPTVTIAPPSAFENLSAHLSGTIDPLGNPATYCFEYKRDVDSKWLPVLDGSGPGCDGDAGSGTGPITKEADVDDLEPNMTYEFRLTGKNGGGTKSSAPQSATTEPRPPTAETVSATAITGDTALLNASVDPQNEATTYYFEFGTSTAYGRIVPAGPPASAGSGGAAKFVSSRVDGLTTGSTYHFRVIASNGTGTVTGGDRAFTTTSQDCTNDAVRSAQGSTVLPDCRAYEQVSPTRKFGYDLGNNIAQPIINLALDDSGEKLTWVGTQPLYEGTAQGALFSIHSQRGDSRWLNTPIVPPPGPNQPGNGLPGIDSMLRGCTPDQRTCVYWDLTTQPFATMGIQRADGSHHTIMASSDIDLATCAGALAQLAGGCDGYFQGISDDGRHVVFSSTQALVPGITPNNNEILYEWVDDDSNGGAGTLRVVNRTDDEALTLIDTAPAALGGNTQNHSVGNNPALRHAISADGSRIFFQNPAPLFDLGLAGAGGGGPLYLREDGTTTIKISAPATGYTPTNPPGVVQYLDAAVDGSVVFFWADGDLTGAAPTEGGIYRHSVTSGLLEFIHTAPRRPIVDGFGPPTAIASDDGTHLYFQDGLDLDLYADDQVRTVDSGVMIGASGNSGGLREDSCPSANITPSGRHLLFKAVNPVGAEITIKRYDAATDTLDELTPGLAGGDFGEGNTLVSACATNGYPRPYRSRLISDDGSYAVFDTKAALVPEDVNGVMDAYEWHNGQVALLSSGTNPDVSSVAGIGADGRNAYFVTRERLAFSDGDALYDIYDARVNGGYDESVAPTCGGQQTCLGAPTAPPTPQGAGTSTFAGPGNPLPKHKKSGKHKKKKQKKRNKSKHGKGKQHNNKRAEHKTGRASR